MNKQEVKKYFIDDADLNDFKILEVEELGKHLSLFGNYFIAITDEQLEELQKGKVLYTIDEYGVCIMLEKKAKEYCDE